MIFDSEIIGALITSIISILIFHFGNKWFQKQDKHNKDREIFDRFLIVESKLNDILRLQDRVSVIESNCNVIHNAYDRDFINMNNRGDMAARDIERLLTEMSAMNYSIQQLKDSNNKLSGKIEKLLELSNQKNEEQDKKIEKLFDKMEK